LACSGSISSFALTFGLAFASCSARTAGFY
jgi:hypothetical protein